jgi:hypothetical protein
MMRSMWGGVVGGLVLAACTGGVVACGRTGLATRAITADVGRGPLVVLVGGGQEQARAWLDAATPGYRFVHVGPDGDQGALQAAGKRVLIVPEPYQALGLQLAERDAADVAGILLLADAAAVSPAWRKAIAAYGWRWRLVDKAGDTAADHAYFAAWLAPRQAAFSVQPSPRPDLPPPP